MKKKQLNILHLESSFGWGGQEIRILKESEGMRNLGHNIIIAVEKNGLLIKKAKEKGFQTYEIRFKKIFWLLSFFKLIYIIKKHSINIINTHSSSDAWLGGVVAKLLKIPVIRTRHLSTPIKKGLNIKLLFDYLADFVVTTCGEVADIIISKTKKNHTNCKSIPTGIDLDNIKIISQEKNRFRQSYNIKQEDFLVGTVCFMRSWKGVDDFLKTAKILENEKDIKFIIIGGGHQDKYIQMAKEINLNNIIFTGHINNPYNAIASLDIFTLLSTAHEGISQASLQAAFLKKPLICTPTGGLKEVCIDKLTGIQVPLFSSLEVAKAILKLKNDKILRNTLSENAKALSLKFSSSKMIKQMQQVYTKLIQAC